MSRATVALKLQVGDPGDQNLILARTEIFLFTSSRLALGPPSLLSSRYKRIIARHKEDRTVADNLFPSNAEDLYLHSSKCFYDIVLN